MNKIFFAADDKIVDIRKDNVFKAVFTREMPQAKAALSALVSALIERNVGVIDILANEPAIDDTRDRQIRYDINCKAENGELINVEMSLYPEAYEPVRMEFHAAKLFSRQDIRGKDKNYDDVKRSYQITILSKDQFFPDDTFFHTFEYYDPINKMPLGGRSRIIALELCKLEKAAEKPVDEMGIKELWAYFFNYLTDSEKRSKINEIVEKVEGIAMTSEVVRTISQDDHEWARLYSEEKAELDAQSRLVSAKRKGEEALRQRFNELADQGLTVEEIRKRL